MQISFPGLPTACLFIILLLLGLVKTTELLSTGMNMREQTSETASLTSFMDWPCCCKGKSNYDSSCSKDECTADSGCKYWGFVAAYDTSQLINSLGLFVAFFDRLNMGGTSSSDQSKALAYWQANYAFKFITFSIPYNGAYYEVTAQILDYCSDSDCNGCCSQNAAATNSNFVIDVEYYTCNSVTNSMNLSDIEGTGNRACLTNGNNNFNLNANGGSISTFSFISSNPGSFPAIAPVKSIKVSTLAPVRSPASSTIKPVKSTKAPTLAPVRSPASSTIRPVKSTKAPTLAPVRLPASSTIRPVKSTKAPTLAPVRSPAKTKM